MRLGSLEVTPLSDGIINLPQQYFAQADWDVHRDLLTDDGFLQIPIGCFLVRTSGQTVLIDAGIGPVEGPWYTGGELIGALAGGGVQPADIDLLLCTHLHQDHIGWVLQDGALTFPNATVRFGFQDIEHFTGDPFAGETIKEMVEALRAKGRLEPIDQDGEVAPGVSTLHAPGHTHGHRCVVLSSGDERLFLLGDAVTCPVQLQETEWEAMSDVDKDLAKRTRESLFREIESSGAMTVAAHFPDLKFGRVLRGEGKRYFA